MSVFRFKKSILNRKLLSCKYFSTALPNEEYTSTPIYPKIQDLSFEKTRERKLDNEHEQIKAVKTVEEKLIKLNMPKYYGYKTFMLTEKYIPYDTLPFVQHVTRTHLIVNESLPEYYKTIEADNLTEIKAEIEEMILMELEGYKKEHELKDNNLESHEVEDLISKAFSRQLHRILFNKTNKAHKNIQTQVDYDPRIESTWVVGGMQPYERVRKLKEKINWLKPYANDPMDRVMCYIGSANLAYRSSLPLKPVVAFSEAENKDLTVPFNDLDPRTFGFISDYRHISNIPGFWPGDNCKFGWVSLHPRGHINQRQFYKDPEENQNALLQLGVMCSFGYLNAQAHNLGFNSFNDITYPLVTQTVVHNGKQFSFFTYQLNTLLMHTRYIEENPKRNICWATKEMQLYEGISDGKVIGLNEEVLGNLIKFYNNMPEDRLGVNLTPYLSSEEKLVAEYEDAEKRQWLEKQYKFLQSNRPRLKEMDEMYHWEKIYKVDNKTRFMDKKLRWFELNQKPYNRRLNEHLPEYVPRALRPDLPRHKGRYKKDYYP